MRMHELVEQAFLAGYRHGVENFAIWRSGERLVGALQRPIGEVLKKAPDDCRDAYRMFLESHQKRHDGDERPIRLEHDDGC